jgi:hypothetical protein
VRQLLFAVKVYDTVESTLTYVEASPLFLACDNYMKQVIKVGKSLFCLHSEFMCCA